MGVLLSIAIYWKVSKVTVVPSRCLLLMRVQDVQQRVHDILESTPGKLEVFLRVWCLVEPAHFPSSNIIRNIFIASKASTNLYSFLMCFFQKYGTVYGTLIKISHVPIESSRWKICRDGQGGFRWIPVHPVVPWDHRSQCPWSMVTSQWLRKSNFILVYSGFTH